MTPDVSAGLVEVTCRPGPDGTTDVNVTYDLTALFDHGLHVIDHLRDGFEAMLEIWQRLAQAAVDRSLLASEIHVSSSPTAPDERRTRRHGGPER